MEVELIVDLLMSTNQLQLSYVVLRCRSIMRIYVSNAVDQHLPACLRLWTSIPAHLLCT